MSKVDLLFMIDNSGSMANKQVKLSKLLPRLVQTLTKGDRYAGRESEVPDGITDKQRYFTAVTSLNLAVVDSSMGGLDSDGDLPKGATPALRSCVGLGDDGLFQTSTNIATMGIVAANSNEFPGLKMGDVVLPADPSCGDVGTPPPYQTYDVANDHPTPDELATAFSCIARVGVRGCPFEQSLEAAWKSIAPSNGKGGNYTFLNGTKGHGGADGDQSGFVRDDAILAVLEVTDEEDCSLTDDGKLLNSYSADAAKFGPTSAINLRCYSEQPEKDGLVYPIDRYVEGLRALKPDNPDRIIFGAIVGVPQDAPEDDYDAILALPEMQYQEDQGNLGFPAISCSNDKATPREVAFPPRRLVKVAQAFGDQGLVYSICAEDYAPALDKLIEKIAAKLKGNCLPRQLTPDTSGLVQCEVFEILPKGDTKCVTARGHDGKPTERDLTNGSKTEKRVACHMHQVPVKDDAPQSGTGWYYDDFSSDLKDNCNAGEQQRIVFSFGDLPGGATAVIDCLQPVASINPNAKGLEAVGSRCDTDPSVCGGRSNDDFTLICQANTCQISCKSNPDCPPGWVCSTDENSGKGAEYCQLPTCPPADDNAATAEVDAGG